MFIIQYRIDKLSGWQVYTNASYSTREEAELAIKALEKNFPGRDWATTDVANDNKKFNGLKYPFILLDSDGDTFTIENEDDIVNALMREGCTLKQSESRKPWPMGGNMAFTRQLYIEVAINGRRAVLLGTSTGVFLTSIMPNEFGIFPLTQTRVAIRTPDNFIELL